ncbi:MAG: AAA family ATPase [Pirellulales bacterium]|nr:AAA family ATPase [Pirellulales bacterium]
MYLDYWQLNGKPFESHPGEAFCFRGEAFQAAEHKLRYALDSRLPAVAFAGPAGVGKTLLLESLAGQLPSNVGPLVHVVFPQMSERDLLVYLAERFGAPPTAQPRHTVEESLRRLEYLFQQNRTSGRHAVLAIDEAHLLEDSGLLEPLRLLLNLRPGGETAFTLVLCGQPTLLPILARFGALDDRIDLKVTLAALSAEQTAAYVQHRLAAAGATRTIFSPDALATAHKLAHGVPRRINRLCDLALLVGFANSQHTLDGADVQAVSDELVNVAMAA